MLNFKKCRASFQILAECSPYTNHRVNLGAVVQVPLSWLCADRAPLTRFSHSLLSRMPAHGHRMILYSFAVLEKTQGYSGIPLWSGMGMVEIRALWSSDTQISSRNILPEMIPSVGIFGWDESGSPYLDNLPQPMRPTEHAMTAK